MTLEGIGSAELGIHTEGGGVYGKPNSTGDDIVNSPALSGTYSFKVDPVNGNGVDAYGWSAGIEPANLPTNTDFFLISFIFRLEGGTFDTNVTIAEISDGSTSGVTPRFIALSNAEAISIFDKDDDKVGGSVDGYITVNTTYNFLWYYDQRDTSNTRDILWIYKPAATLSNKTTISFSDANPDTISDSASGFGIFSAGMIITVSGSTSNDGTYTIDSLTTGVITLVSGDELTTESAGDSVTITHGAQWYKTIDVSGHGDGVAGSATDFISFGSRVGKGALPTVGGPFYVDDMCVQNLGHSPNAQPLASVTVRVKMPTANGTDGDFNTGTGTNPDWNDVKEIPGDEITSYDEGDVDEDFQSYAVADADSGDDVLVVQVVGQQRRTGSGTTAIVPFIHDGTSRDEGRPIAPTTTWRRFRPDAERRAMAKNQINGVNLSETLFNTLEAGVRISVLAASDTVQLSQIALEYAIPGPRELPQDFPILSAGVALGSGNMGII